MDAEILQRLTNTEDHLTERKSKPQRDQCTEAMVAFANSALPNKPGILYVGVNDEGEILQDKAPESWQHDITAWGNGCFPELPVIPRTLTKDGKEFLAVVVPLSAMRPHFARPAFERQGAKTIRASQNEIDEWLAYRNSKVRLILDQRHSGKLVHVSRVVDRLGSTPREMRSRTPTGPYHVEDCNSHFVTLSNTEKTEKYSEPLSTIELSWDHKADTLKLYLRSLGEF